MNERIPPKRTKQSSITSMGFSLLQNPREMCVGRQIQVLGSYWKGHMSNEDVNSLYIPVHCSQLSCVSQVGFRWYTLSSNGDPGDGCGWAGEPRNRRILFRSHIFYEVPDVLRLCTPLYSAQLKPQNRCTQLKYLSTHSNQVGSWSSGFDVYAHAVHVVMCYMSTIVYV
jgi:hypothetical protein